jgi:hypothetical protein
MAVSRNPASSTPCFHFDSDIKVSEKGGQYSRKMKSLSGNQKNFEFTVGFEEFSDGYRIIDTFGIAHVVVNLMLAGCVFILSITERNYPMPMDTITEGNT